MNRTKLSLALASCIALSAGCALIPSSLLPGNSSSVQTASQPGLSVSVGNPQQDAVATKLPAGMGAFRINVTWPTTSDRSTQAIPARTDRFVVTIQGIGITPEITHTITRNVASGTQTEQIMVPAGSSRIVTVKAQNANGAVLAEGSKSGIVIAEGKFTPVTVSISAVVGNIAGKILSEDTNAAVAGATIQVDGKNVKATTDAQGNFTLLDVPVGSATLTVSKEGFISSRLAGTVSVNAEQTTTLEAFKLPVAHWVRQLTGTMSNLYSVHFVDTMSGWAVGDDNHILYTGDGGKNWSEQFNKRFTSYSNLRLYSVRFRDALNGFAVGAESFYSDFRDSGATQPIILKTSNGGVTWSGGVAMDSGGFKESGYPLYDIFLLNPANIFLTGGSFSQYSSDNGVTWNHMGISGSKTFFVSANQGWRVRTDGLYYTNTGGNTWAILPTPSGIGKLLNVFFSDAMNGSVVTDSGTVIRTTDGGANWSVYGSAPSGTQLNNFRFNSQDFGYGVGTGVVYLTSDGGQTWKTQPLPDGPGTLLRDIHFVDATNGWVVGNGGKIYRYRD